MKVPEKEKLETFAFHSTRLDSIPAKMDDVYQTSAGSNIHPYIAGHFVCCNLIFEYRQNKYLFTKPEDISINHINKQLNWLFRMHKNLLYEVAKPDINQEEYVKYQEIKSSVQSSDLGYLRMNRHFIIQNEKKVECVDPLDLPQKMIEWYKEMSSTYYKYVEKIHTPLCLEESDVIELVNWAYDANLFICASQPFTHGSNMLGRLTENLLRSMSGLPWKVIKHDDKKKKMQYAKDIQEKYHNI